MRARKPPSYAHPAGAEIFNDISTTVQKWVSPPDGSRPFSRFVPNGDWEILLALLLRKVATPRATEKLSKLVKSMSLVRHHWGLFSRRRNILFEDVPHKMNVCFAGTFLVQGFVDCRAAMTAGTPSGCVRLWSRKRRRSDFSLPKLNRQRQRRRCTS